MLDIVIAGAIPEDAGLRQRLSAQLEEIRSGLAYAGGSAEIQLTICPAYADVSWQTWIAEAGCASVGYVAGGEDGWTGRFDRIVRVGSALRDTLGEMLCDQGDLLLAVWDEDATGHSGATWALLRIALEKKMPCVWLSSRTGRVYWQERTPYDTYDSSKMRRWLDTRVNAPVEPQGDPEEVPLLFLGRWCYRRFLRKYRATSRPVDAKADVLLQEDYAVNDRLPGAEAFRRRLLERFRSFDRAAIRHNERYQSALYWRAVLSIVTSVFIAIGFYADPLLKGILGFAPGIWGFVAGFGFLVHGLLNLYVYLLSRSRRIQRCQAGMAYNRQVAELLRVLIHFAPFGIHLDLRRLCGGDRAIYASLRRILDEARPDVEERSLSRENAVEAFTHVDELLSDQIAYHQLSLERLSRLTEHLERASRRVFYVGFCLVLLRAMLQFGVSIPGVKLPEVILSNGVQLASFVPSFANMLALMLPAWYTYLSGKLSLCNFRYNRDNHSRMLERLRGEQDNFAHLREQLDEVPVEALRAMGESLAEIMTEDDTALWARQVRNTTIEHL